METLVDILAGLAVLVAIYAGLYALMKMAADRIDDQDD